MKNIFHSAIITLVLTLVSSCVDSLSEGPGVGMPSLSNTDAKVEKTSKTVNLSATVSYSNLVKNAGFYISEDPEMTSPSILASEVGKDLQAEYLPDGYGKTYYYRSFVGNGRDEKCSDIQSFKTLKFMEYVEIKGMEIESMDASSAKVKATYTAAKDVTITEKGFCYGDSQDPTTSDKCVAVSAQDFSAAIPCEKQCYIRAYVKDGDNVAYSESISAVQVESVKLNRTEMDLYVGGFGILTADVMPATASVKTLTWSSSNTGVATVSNGTVKAIGNGTAIITVKCGTKAATCKVTATTLSTGIQLDKSTLSLNVGSSETLTATVLPSTTTDKTIKWSSSNAEVATVNNGTVKAISNGKATITATNGASKVTCEVTVTTQSTSIQLDKSTLSLNVGSSETLTATVLPSTTTDKTIKWSSSNTGVATVSNGAVKAIGNGTATITAANGTNSATCIVTVTTAVTQVNLDKVSVVMDVQENVFLHATVLPATASDQSIKWTSSDNSIATVTNNGVVTAKALGFCTITATAHNGINATCSITVRPLVDLSSDGTANCYIVNKEGIYKFDGTVKGGSTESVGTPASAEVLWESFGTAVTPSVGDIVNNVSYSDGYVKFSTPSTLNNGNAVIAVKDASGNILWSWHIWVCEGFDPSATAQVYNNNAGTMMDRNLGATSAAKGDVYALGLLYQWGRKDPFLGSSSISSNTEAKSTITWPSTVSSNSSNGTIAYATAHPTTFITYNSSNYDWYYTGSSTTDNTRWTSSKGIYDPCPKGWRVPDGGSNGVWSIAFGTSSYWTTSSNWDSTNKGMNFGSTDKKLGNGTIWYPAAGYRDYGNGSLYNVGSGGSCWSCTPDGYYAYYLYFSCDGYVYPSRYSYRATGRAVRCLSE